MPERSPMRPAGASPTPLLSPYARGWSGYGARRGEAGGRELDLFLHRLDAVTVEVDEEQVEAARAAWRRSGKGRHPAGLNYGDLSAYALSRVSGEPLLHKGDDFPRTDVVAV